jgi:hypothetical protein
VISVDASNKESTREDIREIDSENLVYGEPSNIISQKNASRVFLAERKESEKSE